MKRATSTSPEIEGPTRYFVLATVTAHSCHFGNELLDLHRDMAWRRMPVQHGCFHATTDSQAIRDEVFSVIYKHDFTVQATIMEKSKAMPGIRTTDSQFYKTGWLYHFRQSLKNRLAAVLSLRTARRRPEGPRHAHDDLQLLGVRRRGDACPRGPGQGR
jgi:hypothetical protein